MDVPDVQLLVAELIIEYALQIKMLHLDLI